MLTLPTRATDGSLPPPLDVAWNAAAERCLNAWLREIGRPLERGALRLRDGRIVHTGITRHSPIGHHRFGHPAHLQDGPRTETLTSASLCRILIGDVAARAKGATSRGLDAALLREVENSVLKTARFITHARDRNAQTEGACTNLMRECEQSLVFGHPMHPTPKALEGFDDDDLTRYAPELGAAFSLHVFELDGHRLQAHPWQARHLLRLPAARALLRSGRLHWLGESGSAVWPTSSVRTVYDDENRRFIKLPLHVRLTHYWRLNPPAHLRRSREVSAALARVAPAATLTVLPDDVPAVLGLEDALAEQICVLHREGPPMHLPPPMVVAALLEPSPHGGPSRLARLVTQSGGDAIAWLKRYLDVCLEPVLGLFIDHGVSLEAHGQNALLCAQDGWPVHMVLRDLEGGALVEGTAACADLADDSPARYDAETAWKRLCYYFLVNHLGHLVATLAADTATDEAVLWNVVSDALRRLGERDEAWGTACRRLLDAPTLPAKANLVSRLLDLGEQPRYVKIPNPLRSANR